MSHDTILKHRQNSPTECRIRLAGKGLYLGRCCRGTDPKIWVVTPSGLSLPSGSAGYRWAPFGGFTLNTDHNKNASGYRETASVACANQRHDDRRHCGASHRQFSRQAAPPWLIALGEVMILSWNMLLIVYKPQSWSKRLLFWFLTGNAVLMNPQD